MGVPLLGVPRISLDGDVFPIENGDFPIFR